MDEVNMNVDMNEPLDTRIRLSSDKILVEVESNETKKDSGLIVTTSDEPGEIKTGIVVATGKGKVNFGNIIPMGVEVGEKVMFQYGTKVIVEGNPYMLITESADLLIAFN